MSSRHFRKCSYMRKEEKTLPYWIWVIWKNNRNRTATAPSRLRVSFCLHHLRALSIVLSLMRRWVTQRLTRLQTMYNVLKYRKTWWNNDKNKFYATAMEPHRNRKFLKFNNDQYCKEYRYNAVNRHVCVTSASWPVFLPCDKVPPLCY